MIHQNHTNSAKKAQAGGDIYPLAVFSTILTDFIIHCSAFLPNIHRIQSGFLQQQQKQVERTSTELRHKYISGTSSKGSKLVHLIVGLSRRRKRLLLIITVDGMLLKEELKTCSSDSIVVLIVFTATTSTFLLFFVVIFMNSTCMLIFSFFTFLSMYTEPRKLSVNHCNS